MSRFQCIRCGAWVGDAQVHTCHDNGFKWPSTPSLPPPLTEADVRRIVREVIDKEFAVLREFEQWWKDQPR